MSNSLICPVCQKMQENLPAESCNDYKIYSCNQCGLMFSSPMKAGDASFYETQSEYGQKWEFDVVAAKFKAKNRHGALLDIACGDGRFLEKVSGDFTASGIDFNPKAAAEAQQKSTGKIHCMTLQQYVQQNEAVKFEVITAFHVLEHVENPLNFLSDIHKILKKNGLLALSVPNPNRWALQFNRENWDLPPHHLTRWNPVSLSLALEKSGFKILELSAEPISSLEQIRSGFQDLIWKWVLNYFSFGLTRSSRNGEPAAEISSEVSQDTKIKSVLIMGKSFMIQFLVSILAIIAYPFLIFGKAEGKSLLVLAQPTP